MQEYFSNKTIEKLKYDLVRENLLNFDDLSMAEELSKTTNHHIGQALIQQNLISEENLLKFIEDKLHIPYVNLEDYSLDTSCLEFISAEDAKKYKIIPLFRIEEVMTIAMADPLDLFVLNNLIKSVNLKIEPVICSERVILEAIDRFYSPVTLKEKISAEKEKFDLINELNSELINEFQPEKTITAIIYQAFLEDVYEIILENTSDVKIIIFKKDGIFHKKGSIPVLLTPVFNSKLKTLAAIDPLITDVPQLGKFNISMEEENITLIVATFPTTKGERISIKLYRPPQKINGLSLDNEDKIFLEENLNNSGIILIAGPNLSGKSFVAYSILNSMDKTTKNLMTVESIVKYDLTGVNQSELNEKVGFNFEKAVRFIDFQSPDVIYVEEVFLNKDFKHLTLFAESYKTVITEISADNIENLMKKLDSEELIEFKKNIKCLIFVENKDKIQIVRSLGL